MNELRTLSEQRLFDGTMGVYEHDSSETGLPMRFSVYRPPSAADGPVPVVTFLAGLECNEQTFMMKAGAQRIAAKLGLMLVAPDTSPRKAGIPTEDDDWDFGTGAGFYVDATRSPWSKHYRMYSYVTSELPALIAEHFPAAPDRQSIFGHSMGGHGALVCALRNPGQYRSVSALAPIAAPSTCPWGRKAFGGYLGEDPAGWRAYDASELVKATQHPSEILIHQGTADKFLDSQLSPHVFEAACEAAGQSLRLCFCADYDHSYYFISTFVEEQLEHHHRHLID